MVSRGQILLCWDHHHDSESFWNDTVKALATYDDFASDIRIGRVVEVQPFSRARNPSTRSVWTLPAGSHHVVERSDHQLSAGRARGLAGGVVCNLGARTSPASLQSSSFSRKDAEGNVIALAPRSQSPSVRRFF